MAAERPKRENAGNRMTKLIEQQADEQEDDEFYKTTYGGFDELEEDNDYEKEDAEEDVVDSDFSASEQEDEQEGSDEEGKKPRRKKLVIKTSNKLKLSTVSKPKKPIVKRVAEPVLPIDKQERMRASTMLKSAPKKQDNIKRHPRMPQMRRLTQDELLAEARITAEKNLASLAQFLKLEEEKKKNKFIKVRYQGPIVRFQSFRMPCVSEEGVDQTKEEEFCTRNFLEFTDTQNFPKDYFPNVKAKRPEQAVCVVTGLPAKYMDPLTKLPYATIEAFKYIREHRRRIKDEMILKGVHLKRKRKRDSVPVT